MGGKEMGFSFHQNQNDIPTHAVVDLQHDLVGYTISLSLSFFI